MTKIWGYVRCSTEHQAISGLGIEAQVEKIKSHWQHKYPDCEIEIIDDRGISATVPFRKRPGGARILKDVKPGDRIVASKLCRVFRDLDDANSTVRQLTNVHHATLVVLDMGGNEVDFSTALGRFIFQIYAAVMEFERNLNSERVREALAISRAKGIKSNNYAPIGQRWNKAGVGYETCEHTVDQIVLIQELRNQGFSVHEIRMALIKRKMKRRMTVRRRQAVYTNKKGRQLRAYCVTEKAVDWSPDAITDAIAVQLSASA